MDETNKDGDANQQGFKCPFCPCVFSTKSDFQKHMDCFGSGKAEHIESFRRVHNRIERSSFNE